MKIKENYLLRNVADTWVVMPYGAATVDFSGMISLNETGAFLWKQLEQGADIAALAEALTKEFDVSLEEAKADAEAFCKKLHAAGFLDQ